ncbi:MAG TPA: ABC transporter ATP-binding protein [Candidatus Woesebacteria bacterium]|nr:ABC transporter ATP-binding protein [Candidatus Woesebacteria bacterium]HNS95151.1 ABC transporter ATP-binding protein [Candidatus Woesebacteria bacterium]
MTTITSLIELQNVSKAYSLGDGTMYQSLYGITLKINEGEFVAIVGPSGSGKSTTMHILGAIDLPSTGRYLFKGRDISQYSSDELAEIRNKEIGFVFQSFNLLPRTTVYKNVERPMLYGGVPAQEREKRVYEALSLVDLTDKAQNLSNQLSGGQIQRVAVARAIIMNPRLILADEPTGNLDTKTSSEIMSLFKKLHQKQGSTVIVITHEPDIAHLAERVIKIVDGKIVSDASLVN